MTSFLFTFYDQNSKDRDLTFFSSSSREFCLRLYCDVFHGELVCMVHSMVFMGFGLGFKGLDRWKYEGTNVYVTIQFSSMDTLFI